MTEPSVCPFRVVGYTLANSIPGPGCLQHLPQEDHYDDDPLAPRADGAPGSRRSCHSARARLAGRLAVGPAWQHLHRRSAFTAHTRVSLGRNKTSTPRAAPRRVWRTSRDYGACLAAEAEWEAHRRSPSGGEKGSAAKPELAGFFFNRRIERREGKDIPGYLDQARHLSVEDPLQGMER